MKTSQEKAKEMYCKYTEALNIRDLQTTANPFATQCALIAVDEKYAAIINVIVDLKGRGCIDDKTFLKALDDMNTEWEQVKQELCKH